MSIINNEINAVRHSGIVAYWTDELPENLTGLVMVTRPDLPLPIDADHARTRHVFEVAPGITTVPGTPESVIIIGMPWRVIDIAAMYPNAAKYILEAIWEADVGGDLVPFRDKEVLCPDGVTPSVVNIPPHIWG